MAAILNGTAAAQMPHPFPCPPESLAALRAAFVAKVPGLTRVAGGMSKHYDLITSDIRSELKVTSGNSSSLEELMWRPWKDTVQFLQGQINSKLGKRFLGDCGEPMMRAWFVNIHELAQTIPSASSITYEGYNKAMASIGMKGKQEAAAVAFITALRNQPALKEQLHAKWLEFETSWFSTHSMSHSDLREVVKEIIESKDYWICVSKSGAHLIDGLKVIDLLYQGPLPKPHGGSSFHYILVLQRGRERKAVPMECKFNWKNGGQAVQNLNFMLL
jgi:hypothetical protein